MPSTDAHLNRILFCKLTLNSSDALDKTRYSLLLNPHQLDPKPSLASLGCGTEIQTCNPWDIGESLASVRDSPFLEVLKKKGFETLLLIDPIDEYAITQLKEFDGKKLVCVSKEGLKLEEMEDEKKDCKDEAKQFKDLCKAALGNKVISNRITDLPCILVTGQFGIVKVQALCNSSMSSYMASKKTLKLSPNNAIIEELLSCISTFCTLQELCNF